MIELYSAAMTLLVAGTFGTPGYALWGAGWAVAVYRHTSSPTKEKNPSDSSPSHSPSPHSPLPPKPSQSESL